MTGESPKWKKRYRHADLSALYHDAFRDQLTPERPGNSAIVAIIDRILDRYLVAQQGVSCRGPLWEEYAYASNDLVNALCAIANTLNGQDEAFEISVRNKHKKNIATVNAGIARSSEISHKIWAYIEQGKAHKVAFSLVCEEFKFSHETAYKAVREYAKYLQIQIMNRVYFKQHFPGTGLADKLPSYWCDSSAMQGWLEEFVVREGGEIE